MVTSDETVTMRWRACGTHRGEFMGIQPTGSESTTTGMALIRFRGGKAVEEHPQWDQMAMLRQLGILPERESVQEHAERGLMSLRTKVTGKVSGAIRR